MSKANDINNNQNKNDFMLSSEINTLNAVKSSLSMKSEQAKISTKMQGNKNELKKE